MELASVGLEDRGSPKHVERSNTLVSINLGT